MNLDPHQPSTSWRYQIAIHFQFPSRHVYFVDTVRRFAGILHICAINRI